ncbi:MAG: hypothetical protein GBAus27B_000241 [Mycoplasmataceae bacterium]|nr:MAG: hypothetical protein GBAus27B_000241 [Mycoplasmataceae bacterium]
MESSIFRALLERYTKKIDKELVELKKISDLKERENKVSFALKDHQKNLDELKRGKPEHISYHEAYIPFNLDKYEKKVQELNEYWREVFKESNRIREQGQQGQWENERELRTSCCSHCKAKSPTNHYIYSQKTKELKARKRNAYSYKEELLFCSNEHFEKWHKKNYFCCAECSTEKLDGKYKKNKKDGQKFCSDNCYYRHYAETCDNCLEKCVSSYQDKANGLAKTYYRDAETKTGTLCYKCCQEQLRTETDERKRNKEWEKNSEKLSSNLDDLIDSMVDAVDEKGEENSNNNNPSREKERERIQQYIANLENKPNKTREEKEDLKNKKKQLAELDKENQNDTSSDEEAQKDKRKLYFGLAFTAFFIIVLIIVTIWEKRRKKN